jgi:hypothetical protein
MQHTTWEGFDLYDFSNYSDYQFDTCFFIYYFHHHNHMSVHQPAVFLNIKDEDICHTGSVVEFGAMAST